MREVNIAEADVATVAKRIEDFSSHIPSTGVSPDTRPSAIKVIDCVLSLRTSYDKVVVPRLETFMSAHPCVQQVSELADLMASYPTPYEFIQQELNYNSEWKARILQSVVRYVCKIVEEESTASEEEVLQQWATRSKPQECYILKIKGFKLAGFQYLRMLFGADTAKPDVHIIRFLSDTLNRGVSDIESLLLLEAASERVGISVRAVDSFIWKRGARPAKMNDTAELNDETLLKDGIRGKYAKQYAAGTNIVRLDPDVAAAFSNEEAVNDALRFALKVIEEAKHLTR